MPRGSVSESWKRLFSASPKYVLGVLWAFTGLTAANNGVSPTNKISEIIWKDHIQQSRTRKEIKRLTQKVQ